MAACPAVGGVDCVPTLVLRRPAIGRRAVALDKMALRLVEVSAVVGFLYLVVRVVALYGVNSDAEELLDEASKTVTAG
jgi:hypothetical protein